MSSLYDYEFFEIASVSQVLVIVHLIGVALGAGVALYSESLFSTSLKDRVISKDEYRLINSASSVIWVGLLVLLGSGILIFFSDPERYLDSSKFLAKMTIVLILTINGLIFKFVHVPVLKKVIGKDITKSKAFKGIAKPFFISGAISGTSWVAALVLGSLSVVPLSYATIMIIYCLVLIASSFLGLQLAKHYTSPA